VLDHWVKLNGEDRILTPSGWVLLGNIFAEYGGAFPRKGGILTGAMAGAHGLAEAHNTRLTGDAKLEQDGLVTVGMLNESLDGIRSLLTATGAGSVGSVPGTSTGGKTGYEYAFGIELQFCRFEEWTQFPMPRFGDNTEAKPEQCILRQGAPRSWMFSLVSKFNGVGLSEFWPAEGNEGNWALFNRYNGFAIQPHQTEYKCRVTGCRDDRNPATTHGMAVMGLCIARR